MSNVYAWDDIIDDRNRNLRAEIEAILPLDLIPSTTKGWTSKITNGRGELGYFDTAYPHASCTHELLHFKLEAIAGVQHPYSKSNHGDVTEAVSYLYNQLSHHKMFPEFIALGFHSDQFLADSDKAEVRKRLPPDLRTFEKAHKAMGTRPDAFAFAFMFPYLLVSSPNDRSAETLQYRKRLRRLVMRSHWEMFDRILAEWTVASYFDIRRPIAQLFKLANMPETELTYNPDGKDALLVSDVSLPLEESAEATSEPHVNKS